MHPVRAGNLCLLCRSQLVQQLFRRVLPKFVQLDRMRELPLGYCPRRHRGRWSGAMCELCCWMVLDFRRKRLHQLRQWLLFEH